MRVDSSDQTCTTRRVLVPLIDKHRRGRGRREPRCDCGCRGGDKSETERSACGFSERMDLYSS